MRTLDDGPVRLTDQEIDAIRTIIKTADPAARIILFGSRADVTSKGGDIDLLILSSILRGRDKREIRMNLCSLLGDQKIDVIIAKDTEAPFVRIALTGGVEL